MPLFAKFQSRLTTDLLTTNLRLTTNQSPHYTHVDLLSLRDKATSFSHASETPRHRVRDTVG